MLKQSLPNELIQNVEKKHFIMILLNRKSEKNDNFKYGVFSKRNLVPEEYCNVVNAKCGICECNITRSYIQYKNNDWKYICKWCFCI
jgi:hypothetical protein